MSNLISLEKKINSELTTKIKNTRIKHNQIYIEIDKDDLIDVILFLKTNKDSKFRQLIDITVVDYPEENQRFKRAWKVASLIETFGKNAIIVLSGYGIGADTGARILRNMTDQELMYKQIYESERQYVMTRGFWD